ncbi:Dual specificity phosphatase [Pleurostoma richardsiae]|uniref:protein-tyrosine-phosphatase n=1 Tax=Pleurostoma richardsiae TaxID=41990 RepID=A0AA38R478_9PEZI|nr:Dual specificity phosphatase [Pleurostoma richardsiae]
MPSATARRLYEDQIPSFMSVFDLDAEAMHDTDTVTVVDPRLTDMEASGETKLESDAQLLCSNVLPVDGPHKHHDSTSTQNSADSSPTTTVSCTDSSSLSDPSPSSSPDSPVNLVSLSSFPGTTFGGLSMASLSVTDTNSLARPMTSPSPRRARNMKGLSIQPPFAGSGPSSLISEPSSPSFIKPKIPGMKRKPSQLSLKTSTSDLINRTTLEVPQSPSLPPILQRRALKHSTSSPHMLSGLKSATFGPVGGMTFPAVLERNETGLSEFLRPSKATVPAGGFDSTILEEESPIRTQIANRAAFEFEPYHEHENNEDQKTPGYPDGPIAIYGDNVYLYLEPTAEEAAKFDVVINVAREVSNPFKALSSSTQQSQAQELQAGSSPIPDTAVTTASFATAFEFPPEDASPTTPKAMFPSKEPEYIHIPWDHNTDIGKDLMMLCETIEKKTTEGKKVLVHCQQGASRSASLIIAYGLYLNPDLSVNDAYYAAQSKSQWISPNMRLMYCLQDFQKDVSKKRLPPGSAYRPRTGNSPTKHRATLSVDAINSSPKQPFTAPLPGEDSSANDASPGRSPLRPRGATTPGREAVSPGPSSAPSSFSWKEKEDENDPGKLGRFNLDQIFSNPPKPAESDSRLGVSGSLHSFSKPPPSPGFASHRFEKHGGLGFVPLSLGPQTRPSMPDSATIERQPAIISSSPDDAALMSPRAETMTNNPLHEAFADFTGMRFVEVPPTPSEGLFSPRETMFPRDPFYPFGRPSQVADPRSPPTKGETPIVRSIDELI